MPHEFVIGVQDSRLGPGEQIIPTTRVPGNEQLRRDIEAGNIRKPIDAEVNRAIEHTVKQRELRQKRFMKEE